MKLLNTEQTRAWDAYTIENEPISSYNLMERAALAFSNWFTNTYDVEKPVTIFCGTGNNGGDGLAVARLLHQRFFNVKVYICCISKNETPDFQHNLELLPQRADILRGYINDKDAFPTLPNDTLIIDALLGSGLSRSVEGYWADFMRFLNNSDKPIISIDTPSGLFSDKITEGVAIRADHVVSFETPKLAFLMPENQWFVQNFTYLPIGLNPDFLKTVKNHNIYVTKEYVTNVLKKRSKYDHKGTFGHALIVAGSFGMAGAAVLAAKACMRSGVGLLTVHTPQCNRIVLQTTLPEAMVRADADEYVLSQNTDTENYDAVGIGCGIGKAGRTAAALKNYLMSTRKPMVLDADALNLIADNPEMWEYIPKESILTPHPKEFERLFGKIDNDFERLERLRVQAKSLKINILLKGAHTIVADTEGVCFFNATGNAGMATAGSGDVLTGIVTGLLAQGYAPSKAAIVGVYLHGLAGDLAAEKLGQQSMLAGDIVDNLGAAYKILSSGTTG
jgi:ADP-dependent NAD(P)H-hydrate dehydratase / NAD(P)H-hydrate epimerase